MNCHLEIVELRTKPALVNEKAMITCPPVLTLPEMRSLKHPFQSEIRAQKGVEF